jgi:hypothetical protein
LSARIRSVQVIEPPLGGGLVSSATPVRARFGRRLGDRARAFGARRQAGGFGARPAGVGAGSFGGRRDGGVVLSSVCRRLAPREALGDLTRDAAGRVSPAEAGRSAPAIVAAGHVRRRCGHRGCTGAGVGTAAIGGLVVTTPDPVEDGTGSATRVPVPARRCGRRASMSTLRFAVRPTTG